jgi:hypothetical protein
MFFSDSMDVLLQADFKILMPSRKSHIKIKSEEK